MITVSPAEPRDAVAIAALLEDLSRFYGTAGPDPLEVRLVQIDEALFANPPAARALLARDEQAGGSGELAGLATYSFLWPTIGATRSLYLKELYVRDTYRSWGVGKLLMQAVFETAARCGCSRVEWTTDVGNAAARAFYARLGLPEFPSKVFYRIEHPRLGGCAPGDWASGGHDGLPEAGHDADDAVGQVAGDA